MSTGAWDHVHADLTEPLGYGEGQTYKLAADWLEGCSPIEDWGCGGGYFSQFVPPEAYIGVDGSRTPYATVTADLVHYRSTCEGLLLRHVLEHSHEWAAILDNALASFTKRMCIVLFTPLVGRTHVLHTEPEYDNVPVIAFSIDEITEHAERSAVAYFGVSTNPTDDAHYGAETMIYLSR